MPHAVWRRGYLVAWLRGFVGARLRGREAVAHNVYLADSHEALSEKTVATGFCISEQLPVSRNIATPNKLVSGKTYFWRVDAVEADGVIRDGGVWEFTVK